jgi:8-oxo-dGTP pyrophosphatase MutT (NUDIX family)
VAEFEIDLQVGAAGTAVLSWTSGAPGIGLDRRVLSEAVQATVRDAFENQGLRRVEAVIAADDDAGQRAVLWAGFRLEGRRREAIGAGAGRYVDELIFARLRTDAVHGPDGFSGVANSTMPRKRLIAHVLMRSADGRVLLCETQFKADWELPGGIVEPGESPRIGAIREVKEELGIDIELGALLAVDWMPPYLGWDDALELIFDGGTVTDEEIAAYALQPNEIKTVRLIDLPDAEPYLTPLSYRRLTAITTLDVPRTLTMEDGRPV